MINPWHGSTWAMKMCEKKLGQCREFNFLSLTFSLSLKSVMRLILAAKISASG